MATHDDRSSVATQVYVGAARGLHPCSVSAFHGQKHSQITGNNSAPEAPHSLGRGYVVLTFSTWFGGASPDAFVAPKAMDDLDDAMFAQPRCGCRRRSERYRGKLGVLRSYSPGSSSQRLKIKRPGDAAKVQQHVELSQADAGGRGRIHVT